MRTYEALIILPGLLNDETVGKAVERIRGCIERVKGSVKSASPLGKRSFCRPMKKHEAGHYARVRFEADPGAISPLLARLKLDAEIFRVQIVQSGAAADARGEKRRESKEDTTNGKPEQSVPDGKPDAGS